MCSFQNQQSNEAIRECTEFLQKEPENIHAIKDRAEAYIQEEMYEEGIFSFDSYLFTLYARWKNMYHIFKTPLGTPGIAHYQVMVFGVLQFYSSLTIVYLAKTLHDWLVLGKKMKWYNWPECNT